MIRKINKDWQKYQAERRVDPIIKTSKTGPFWEQLSKELEKLKNETDNRTGKGTDFKEHE